jgi:sialate O-acetylesterase
MKRFLIIAVLAWLAAAVSASEEVLIHQGPKKVACVGNSVTFGYGLKDPSGDSYPAQLADLLGENYQVGNFGRNGATLLSEGHNPYVKSEEYQRALAYQPDIVVIHLGLNDTDPRNWPNYRDEFITDYQTLIRSFQTASRKPPEIHICLMTPIFPGHPRFKSGTRDWFYEIGEAIRKVADNTGVNLIDLHTPLHKRPDLFADNLHPNEEGAAIIARTVYATITGDYGGFRLAPVFGEHMVVSQKRPVVFYGTSNRGDRIEIRFDEQVRQVTPSSNGYWKAQFLPVPSGGPYPLEIRVNDTLKVNWQDILSGEVWLCSGQSNMEFELKYAENGRPTAANANDNGLRLLNFKSFVQTSDIEFDKASLDRINCLDFFDGRWQGDSPATSAEFSAIAYFFGRELRDRLKVPVGLIQVAVGGAPIESFIDRKTLEFNPVLVDQFLNREKNDFIFDWVRGRIAKNIAQNNTRLQRHPYDPAYIFEAGIAPLGPLPIRGVLWYQGESNAHHPELYKIAFREFTDSWRRFLEDPEMPVLIAQLSGIDRPTWPWFREVQRQLANEIPHTGLVVTYDLGDSLNVHPVRKEEVGERFALQTLQKAYGKAIAAEGPVPLKIIRKSGKSAIIFQTSGKLKTTDGGPVRELEICGPDGIFREVPGCLKGKKILINLPIENIASVRYGWKPYSRGNLTDPSGLPASTFRLDRK